MHFIEHSLAQSCFVAVKFHTLLPRSQASVMRSVHIMSTKRKRLVLSIQDKQSIILPLEKGTSFSSEYAVSKQQISDIRKNKDSGDCQFVDSSELQVLIHQIYFSFDVKRKNCTRC